MPPADGPNDKQLVRPSDSSSAGIEGLHALGRLQDECQLGGLAAHKVG